MTIRFIEDPEVDLAVEDAARAACERLDEVFPGKDVGGIGSNFQGLLAETLRRMLRGHDPLASTKGYRTTLPKLVLDDESFGDPRTRGPMFVVTTTRQADWNSQSHRYDEEVLALDDNNRHFVRLTNGERLDPFVTYDDAVRGAVAYLKANYDAAEDVKLSVRAVVPTDSGYELQ